jgi:hypothetical protein
MIEEARRAYIILVGNPVVRQRRRRKDNIKMDPTKTDCALGMSVAGLDSGGVVTSTSVAMTIVTVNVYTTLQ